MNDLMNIEKRVGIAREKKNSTMYMMVSVNVTDALNFAPKD